MNRKAIIICSISAVVCLSVGMLFLSFVKPPQIGIMLMFIAVWIFSVVLATIIQEAIDSLIEKEISYRRKIDELYRISMEKSTEEEEGGE